MSKIKLDLQRDNEAQSALLEVSDATESQVDKAIDGFFSFFGVNPTPTQPRQSEPPMKTAMAQPAVEPTLPEVESMGQAIRALRPAPMTIPAQSVTIQPAPVSKAVHNPVEVEGNPTSMEEVYPKEPVISPNAPEHVHTGIKKGFNGQPNRYQCRYRCPKCKKSGKHFIPEGVETVDCHHCQCSMPVKKATPGTQGIAPDRFKNWFVAGEQKPVLDFETGKAHNLK